MILLLSNQGPPDRHLPRVSTKLETALSYRSLSLWFLVCSLVLQFLDHIYLFLFYYVAFLLIANESSQINNNVLQHLNSFWGKNVENSQCAVVECS